jgi:hypothetical protein
MARFQKQCPNCKAETGPNYRFCLACGAELRSEADLPQPEPVPAPKPARKNRKSNEPAAFEAAQPPSAYSYSFGAPPPTEATPLAVIDPPTKVGKKSGSRMRLLLLLLLLVVGAIGGMMYWNDHPSNASGGVNWTALTEFDFANVWNKPEGTAEAANKDPMATIPADAVEARAIAVADDGLITIRYKGKDIKARLAGVPVDFSEQCLGGKGVGRLQRVLPKGAVIYVLLDGDGRLGAASSDGPQQVYLWRVDAEANKVRYANQELIASGEAALAPVVSSDHSAAQALEQASVRAIEKQKGRFGSGACS